MTLVSTRQPLAEGDVLVGFNGYLRSDDESRPEEIVHDRYTEHGTGFVDRLVGNFRVAVYDAEREHLIIATDRPGNQPIHYTTGGDDFHFASHISPLLALPGIGALNTDAVRRYLRSWPVGYSNPETLVNGVARMAPSQRVTVSGGAVHADTYWTPFTDSKRQVSDAAAVDRIEAALTDAVDAALDHHGDTPNLLFSGGLDSSLLAAILQDRAGSVNTYTHGYRGQTLETAKRRAERLGTSHHEVRWDGRLPTPDEIWELEVAGPLAPFYNTYRDVAAFDEDAYFSGLPATVPFPVGLEKIRKIGRLRAVGRTGRKVLGRVLSASASVARHAGVISGKTCNDLWNGSDLVAAPSQTVAATRPMTVNPRTFGVETGYGLERRLAERSDTVATRLDAAVVELELRERVQRWAACHTNRIRHYNVFCDPRLLEFTYSLPMRQVQERRLERMLARRYLPAEMAEAEPGGLAEVAETYRALIRRNRDEFDQTLTRFRGRGILDNPYTGPEDSDFPEMVFHRVNLYVMEKWLQTFMDRDTPWEHPSS
ncbi:MAG: asparagine synthase-related protein [Candidatus Nanohaloarchaea archaeon]